jgi:hypothetical protein
MVMVSAARRGHSLPELIVATTFLAATLVAVGGGAVLGARWTDRAATVQRAVRVARGVLDSLAAASETRPGSRGIDGLRLMWTSDGDAIRVEVSTGPERPPLVVLEGARLPDAPVLPDAGSAPGPVAP